MLISGDSYPETSVIKASVSLLEQRWKTPLWDRMWMQHATERGIGDCNLMMEQRARVKGEEGSKLRGRDRADTFIIIFGLNHLEAGEL
jgi:hypothetical protein